MNPDSVRVPMKCVKAPVAALICVLLRAARADDEAVYLSDRVIVLSARQGAILEDMKQVGED